MYKTTESTKQPEYVNCSLRDGDYIGGIQLDLNPPKPQYRVFAMNQNNQKTRSRSETSFSDISLSPSISRSTATQDLADFLKTSSPEDYKRYLSPSSEDISTSPTSRGGSFRFLWSSTPLTSPIKANATPPKTSLHNKNVVSKTTSKGKPYLQIRVDYGGTCSGSATGISQQTSFSSETPSDMHHRNSTVATSASADSGIRPREPPCSGERSLSPPPPRNAQESRASLDVVTMGRYQQFLDSGLDTKARSNSIGSVPHSYTSDIVSAGMAELRAYQKRERMKSPPRSPEDSSTPYSSSGVESTGSSPRRRSRSDGTRIIRPRSQVVSARSSMISEMFDDVTDTEFEGTTGTGPQGQRKKSRKAPPRPGPPPNRSLPSLPEGHGDLRPYSEGGCPVSTRNSQMSSTSTTPSQVDDAESIRSDRKTREERVKARKAKDINQHKQLMREKGRVRQSLDSCISDISGANSDSGEIGQSNTRRSTSRHSTFSDTTDRKSPIAILGEQPASSTNSLPSSPSSGNKTHAHYTQSFGSTRDSENGRLQLSESPTLSSPVHSGSPREMELEARMLAVERKNKMLEQALMAVIRSTVRGQAQRRTELLKANDMEELLDELDLEELPVPFVGGQLV